MTTAASKMKEGSTQGWSMLKTKLAAAGPVAERIHTMGLNVMTDIYLGDTTVEALVCVEDPRSVSCFFLEKYKTSNVPVPAESPSKAAMGLLRMCRLSLCFLITHSPVRLTCILIATQHELSATPALIRLRMRQHQPHQRASASPRLTYWAPSCSSAATCPS